MDFDVFISHASEDKDFVEPLAEALQKAGLRVWYDSFEIKLGDDIAEKITQGLLRSLYGVVVLSKVFLEKKKWTEAELNALVNRQATGGKKVILPVWHNISAGELSQYNPILAGKRAVRSDDGIDIVVSQIVDACAEPDITQASSLFQSGGSYGLREQCLEIIRQDDLIAWRKLIDEVSADIPGKLKEWKTKGEAARKDGHWDDAVYEAAEICLPGFVPIFASVEAGKSKYWRESIGILRRLAILEDEMGGGLVTVLRIGGSLLAIAGFLGMSISANLKLFDLINDWMYLKLPGKSEGVREATWLEFYSAHRLPKDISYDINKPFDFFVKLSRHELLVNFFPDEDRLIKNIYSGNLLASLIELRSAILTPKWRKILDESPENISPNIYPFWFQMQNKEFQTLTLDLFGDSQTVYNYVLPDNEFDLNTFWNLWKKWRISCSNCWPSNYGIRFRFFNFMLLPGEPPAQ